MLAKLRMAERQEGAASDARREALMVIEAAAARLQDATLRATFLSSPQIQHIWQLADTAVLSTSSHAARSTGP
jgi:hypothetical protein